MSIYFYEKECLFFLLFLQSLGYFIFRDDTKQDERYQKISDESVQEFQFMSLWTSSVSSYNSCPYKPIDFIHQAHMIHAHTNQSISSKNLFSMWFWWEGEMKDKEMHSYQGKGRLVKNLRKVLDRRRGKLIGS